MPAKIVYTKELLQEAVDSSISVMEVLDFLGKARAGGTHAHVSKRIREFGIDTSHFLGRSYNRGTIPHNKKTASEVLVKLPKGSSREKTKPLRRAMIEVGIAPECGICGLSGTWQGEELVLEIDHIDGDWLNNLRSNVRFLCPNCHSQQKDTNRSWKTRAVN